jgi:alkaline phosphatase
MSALSFEKKLIWKVFFAVPLLGLLVLNQPSAYAGNEDKAVVKQKVQLTTGRVDRPVRPVKNIILLIPDGCSLATISAARWYQWLQNPDKPALYIDPYICGTVRTFSSNAPIGDSAPTTSCYMTGELSRTGYVATYPPSDGDNDLFTVDTARAYQPMMTVLEAAKLNGKSTGLVFTCEFPHATPADCSSHDYSRANYTNIADQMVHNKLDVVIGGGTSYLKPDQQAFLKNNGYSVQLDDAAGLRSFNGNKLWSLFGTRDMPFDLDRNPATEPSLEEMTVKALETLSKNKKGFFVMVEGSKVDWAAHANDPIGMITDFLSFDRACKVALDFARKDGNTAVLILPDHGNSGFSIGTSRLPGYDKLTKDQLFRNVLKFKRTAAGLADMLNAADHSQASSIVKKYTEIELNDKLMDVLDSARDYVASPIPQEKRVRGPYLSYALAKIMTDSTCFGFTTNGHTGEEVFFANYHPQGDILNGVHFNFEVNEYLCKLFKLEGKLPTLTARYFAKHTAVFKGMKCVSNTTTGSLPELTVTNGSNTLLLKANSNVVLLNGKELQLSTVVVYVDKNQTFYLPADLADLLK